VVILFFGPPGSGKGTQSKKITEWLHIPSISTGELFRAEVAAGTPLGLEAQLIMSQGGLVGDEVANRMLEKRLHGKDLEHGFLLDGYPRTIAQAQFLDHLLDHLGWSEPKVLHLDVPRQVIVERLSGRRFCPACQSIYNIYFQPPKVEGRCDREGAALEVRADDREEVVRARLEAYDRQTDPVIQFYEKRDYHRLDGNQPAEEVARRAMEHLESSLVRVRHRKA
jgi:adenylate kinase